MSDSTNPSRDASNDRQRDIYSNDDPAREQELLDEGLLDDLGLEGEQGVQAKQERGSSSPTGNRPAEGARQVLPGEVLSGGFQGSEAAGDFLGLDVEFTGAEREARNLDLASAPGSPARFPVTAEEQEDDGYAEFSPSTEALRGSDPLEEEELFEEDFEDAFDSAFEDEPVPSRRPLALAAFLVGGLAALGVLVGPKFLSGDVPPARGPEVANTTTTTDPDPATDPEQVVETFDHEPIDIVATDPLDPADDTGTTAVEQAPWDPIASGTDPRPSSIDDPVDATSFDTDVLTTLLGPTDDGTRTTDDPEAELTSPADLLPVTDVEFPDFSAGFEWVSEDKLDMVWRGSDVPMKAISAPARTLMPRVGAVRVFLDSGDTVDGRLYAVGHDMVWLEMVHGRVGLDGQRVVRFEHLAVDVSAGMPNTQSAPISGERVRALVAGGMVYGRIIKRDGDYVTLLQDRGGRVTLRGAEIEPLGSGRAIVVQR